MTSKLVIKTWGLNDHGQLMLGDLVNRLVPTIIPAFQLADVGGAGFKGGPGSPGFTHIQLGDVIYAAGANNVGQLGDGTTIERLLPVLIAFPVIEGFGRNIGQMGGGSHHPVMIAEDTTGWAFGLNNAGQLGDGSLVNRHSPVLMASPRWVEDDPDHTSVDPFPDDPAGTWTVGPWVGFGHYEQVLGGGFGGLPLVLHGVSGGQDFTCILGAGATSMSVVGVYWVGQGSTSLSRVLTGPQGADTGFLEGITRLSGNGGDATYAVALQSGATSSDRKCWIIENGAVTGALAAVGGVGDLDSDDVLDMRVGRDVAAALLVDGTVALWGSLPGLTGTPTVLQFAAAPFNNVTSIALGADHLVMRRSDGTLWTWGKNTDGQLGDGTTVDQLGEPIQITSETGVVRVGAYESVSFCISLADIQDDMPFVAVFLN